MADAVAGYVDAVADRLRGDGCEVHTENWAGVPVVVGYRADFRMRWMATRLHLFTLVAPATGITVAAIEGFTKSATDYAIARRGSSRGFQSGVALLPCLVSAHVDREAMDWARHGQRLRFACMARPVAVDVTRGEAACFRGTAGLGWVYSGHLRRKLDAYFPVASPVG